MAKFSVARFEDGEGSSNRTARNNRESKRARRVLQLESHLRERSRIEAEDVDEEFEEFPVAEEEEKNSDINNGGGSPITKVLDPQVFDCPVCFEYLTPPVLQCESGHLACSSCCTKLMNKCPSCCSPIGYQRARGVEQILESMSITCKNSRYGCREIMTYSQRYNHEKTCPCIPFSCPLMDCRFVGSSRLVYQHFRTKHKNLAIKFRYNRVTHITLDVTDDYFFLQEEVDGVLFILNNKREDFGYLISVSAIAPLSTEGFFYDILAKQQGKPLRFQGITDIVPNLDIDEKPLSNGFLAVSKDLFGTLGRLDLDLSIWPHGVSPSIIQRVIASV